MCYTHAHDVSACSTTLHKHLYNNVLERGRTAGATEIEGGREGRDAIHFIHGLLTPEAT